MGAPFDLQDWGIQVGHEGSAKNAGQFSQVVAALVITGVLVATVIGAVMTFVGTPTPAGAAVREAAGNQIGDDVATSFGLVAVEFVRQVDGVTSRALNGSTHGVNGLVDANHAKIQAAVAITNRSERPITYASDQFRLKVTRKGEVSYRQVSGGDLPDTRVLPNAGITGHLDFVVPRTNADLAIEYDDPARDGPILIELGKADFDPAAPGSHEH